MVGDEIVTHPKMTRYVLAAFIDASGQLIDWCVAPKTAVRFDAAHTVIIQSEVDATDQETAHVIMVRNLVTSQHDTAARFWDRIAAVPRIRLAATRHMGLRAIGPILRLHRQYLRPSSEGTYGWVDL